MFLLPLSLQRSISLTKKASTGIVLPLCAHSNYSITANCRLFSWTNLQVQGMSVFTCCSLLIQACVCSCGIWLYALLLHLLCMITLTLGSSEKFYKSTLVYLGTTVLFLRITFNSLIFNLFFLTERDF